MIIDVILLAFCSFAILIIAFLIYWSLKEIEMIEKNVKSIEIRVDKLEEDKTEAEK